MTVDDGEQRKGNRQGSQVDDPEVWTAPSGSFWVPGRAPFWVFPCTLASPTRWLGTVSPTGLFLPNARSVRLLLLFDRNIQLSMYFPVGVVSPGDGVFVVLRERRRRNCWTFKM